MLELFGFKIIINVRIFLMKFVYTKHALKDKLPVLRRFGWVISKSRIEEIIANPKWKGVSRHGQETAMSLVDEEHILRVVIRRENDIITVITLHIARRGKYESTL